MNININDYDAYVFLIGSLSFMFMLSMDACILLFVMVQVI